MGNFAKVRLATLFWGFLVMWAFTGNLGITSKSFIVIAIGNTVIMRYFIIDE